MDVVSYIWLYHVELLANPVGARADRRVLVFSRFSFSAGGVNSVENKIWKIGACSCSYVFSSISLLYFPVVLPPPPRPLPRSICRQYRFTSTVIFWAGFYYGWHKWCKCISFNYATLRDTGVHVVVGFYAFPLVAGSRVFPIFSRSPVTIHVALQRVL